MRWKLFFRDLTIVLGAVIVGGGIVYGIMQYRQMHTKQNSVLAAQTEVDTLIGQVGKLIELPKEIPTVATVSDVKKLQDQPFFTNAKNGDKVLIFVQAKEAVLYRPSENKIIKVSPVNTQSTPTPSNAAPTETPMVTATPTQVLIKVKATITPVPTK
ncbi:MAG TPA: hypothetical protein VLF89_07595 [Candidatus Saccharimonadales bacterium]|nr:hypothetical protein [Candidatus Saccharimonadales bacterium]